jgi:SprT protein
VLHEYAHLYVFENFGTRAKPHGPEWRDAMKVLGGEGRATHNYPVERKSMQPRIAYKCNVCGWVLERVRRFKRNRIYIHVGCGGRFIS